MTNDLVLGQGRTIPSTSGGAVVSASGQNYDIVAVGRTAGITGAWSALRVHQYAGYDGLAILGDTSQTANYFRIDNSAGTNLLSFASNGTLDIKGSATPKLRLIENTTTGNPTIQFLDGSNADAPTEGLEIKYESATGNSFIKNIYGGGALIFQTAGANEAMRILQNQYLLIGYTSSNGSYRLQVNSQIFATSTSIATSDVKFKKNVKEITGGLNMIDSLRPVQFDWKKNKTHNFVEGKTVGFIAQEVQEALKDYEWVGNLVKSNYNEETKEEFLGLAESNIIPLLVSAVKELKAEIVELSGMIK
jgi:hypothetical protein